MSWYELWVAEQLRRALWVLGILIAVALAGLWLYGCGPAPKAPTAADLDAVAKCDELMTKHLAEDATCEEAEKAINAEPACQRTRHVYHLHCHQEAHQ